MNQTKKTIKIKCKGADLLPFEALMQFQGDLKKLSKTNLEKLKTLILKKGFIYPIAIWKNNDKNYILDGHQRDKVLKSLQQDGYEIPLLPVVYIEAKNIKDAKEIVLAIWSQYGEFDEEELSNWLKDIDDDIAETLRIVDKEININIENETIDDDEIPEEIETITKTGDLWELGKHRLLCGDSTRGKNVDRLMDDKKANICITSPPYWVGKEYENENSEEEINIFIKDSVNAILKTIRKDESRIIINTGTCRATSLKTEKKTRVILLLDKWINNFYNSNWYLRNIRHWIKGGGDSIPRRPIDDIVYSGIEYLLTFYCIDGKSRGQNRLNYKWMQQSDWTDILGNRQENKAGYPIELPKRFILLYSLKSEIILDPFLGNGTTLMACEKTNRICYGMEIEPRYCDVIVERYKNWCKANQIEPIIKLNGKLCP